MRSFYFIEFCCALKAFVLLPQNTDYPYGNFKAQYAGSKTRKEAFVFTFARGNFVLHAVALFKARGFLFPDVFAYCEPSDFFRASWPHAASISEPFSRRSVYEAPASSRILANAARLPASLRCHERAGTLL